MQTAYVITASRTADGRAVYLGADRQWRTSLDGAAAGEEGAKGEALAWARTRQFDVCDPYLLEVGREGGRLIPRSARERIRAAGPGWVGDRFGYQVL